MVYNTHKRILVVAYVFPPIAYAGSHRTIRLLKSLFKLGYKIDVVTIKIQKDLSNDFDLLSKVDSSVNIHRTATFDIWRLYNKCLKKPLLKTTLGRIADKFISFFVDIISQPDHMVFWIPFAVLRSYRILKMNNIEAIYTSSPPHSQLITGRVLKFLSKAKWIADLRDPITMNIASSVRGTFGRFVDSKLEKLTIKHSDMIITNSVAAMQDLKTRYNIQHVKHIQNAFDPDDYKLPSDSCFKKFTIAHLGTIYQFRNADPILDAVSQLHDKAIIHPTNFQLIFAGIIDRSLEEKIRRYNIESYVNILAFISHKEAIQMMLRSHLLLLIKGFGANGLGQIPGKLFEYIGSQRKILYIGPIRSEVSDILNQTDIHHYIVGNDVKSVGDSILGEFRRYQQNFESNENRPERYRSVYKLSCYEMADRFDEVFKSL